MTTVILVVQVIVALTQIAFLILGLILLAGVIRSSEALNEQSRAKAAMDDALASMVAEADTQEYDPWQGRWPPWDEPGSENTTN